ncbi:MAG TPA: hypothetical protein VKT53_04890 [Candidatus Acidoferrum sp.]|nr:hypothetical protein [Candidatus Acidoferrum sp.]
MNAVVGLFYYLTYKESIVESGRQTNRLICAANIQADAAKKMVDAASTQAEKMTQLSVQAIAQAKAASALANEAKRAADISRQALDAERARFVEDQRPYIWVKKTENPQLQAGRKATWSFEYTNYGRSPAIGVRLRAQTIFGTNSRFKIRNDLYDGLHDGPNDRGGSVMPPQDPAYSTGFSVEILSEEDVKQIPQHDDGIALLAYFEYFDVRGNLYHTRFCTFRFKSGAFGECPGVDRNRVDEVGR